MQPRLKALLCKYGSNIQNQQDGELGDCRATAQTKRERLKETTVAADPLIAASCQDCWGEPVERKKEQDESLHKEG